MNTIEPQITGHISKRFDQELENIRNQVLIMGGLVETQVNNGIKCLLNSDSELARRVVEDDLKVNRMEVEIDDQCVQILARRQPAASDLRLIVAIIKTITDLERIGDQAQKLGKNQLELIDQGASSSKYVKLEHLGELVSKNLNRALDAFARMNVEDALETIERDVKVNDEFKLTAKELHAEMERRASSDEKPIKGLILSSPSNPTGAMLSPNELKELCELCDREGIHFLSDEIYHGISYGQQEATALQYSSKALIINSFSKYYSSKSECVCLFWNLDPSTCAKETLMLLLYCIRQKQ